MAFVALPEVGFWWDEWWCAGVAWFDDDEGVASEAVWWFEHADGSVGLHQ